MIFEKTNCQSARPKLRDIDRILLFAKIGDNTTDEVKHKHDQLLYIYVVQKLNKILILKLLRGSVMDIRYT